MIFVDAQPHIIEYGFEVDIWFYNDLTTAAGGAPLPAANSPLDGYATPWNGQQHVNYLGDDPATGQLHVQELFF